MRVSHVLCAVRDGRTDTLVPDVCVAYYARCPMPQGKEYRQADSGEDSRAENMVEESTTIAASINLEIRQSLRLICELRAVCVPAKS